MRRGAHTKVMAVRPPPQAWLANCLHPTRVVTVSSANKALGLEAIVGGAGGAGGAGDGGKTAGGAGGGGGSGAGSKGVGGGGGGGEGRGTKRGRGEGSGAKYEVTEQDGFIWVQCDDCSKWRYAPETCVDKDKPDAKWKCDAMTDPKRPGLTCEAPEDAYPRDTYFVGQGVPPPPEGWRREVVPRKTVAGADAYYYSPCGKRMRSKPDVQRFLDKVRADGKYTDVSIDSFDFSTHAKAIKPPAAAAGGGKPAKEGKSKAVGGAGTGGGAGGRGGKGGRGRGRGRGAGRGGRVGRGKKGDEGVDDDGDDDKEGEKEGGDDGDGEEDGAAAAEGEEEGADGNANEGEAGEKPQDPNVTWESLGIETLEPKKKKVKTGDEAEAADDVEMAEGDDA